MATAQKKKKNAKKHKISARKKRFEVQKGISKAEIVRKYQVPNIYICRQGILYMASSCVE